MNSTSSQRLASQLPATVGVPFQVLVLGGVAILALIVGAFSVGAGFALFVLGLLAALILDFMMWQQHEERTPAATSAPRSERESRADELTGAAGRPPAEGRKHGPPW